MALLTQIAPVADTVTSGLSQSYNNQLNVATSSGTLTWKTTAPSTALLVAANGMVSTTGVLEVGSYSVSGTVVDTALDSGSWSFTLEVTGPVSPQTGVTPVQAVLPTGIEILVPFQIDPATGGVAIISDYGTILSQHIQTIIMTAANERVMNPAYGFGLEQAVFTPINARLPSTLQSDIKTAIEKWESAVSVLAVNVSQSPQSPSLLTVTVEFVVVPFSNVNTVAVTTGGTISQVNP